MTKDRLLELTKRIIQLQRYQDEQKADFWIVGMRKEEHRVEEYEKGQSLGIAPGKQLLAFHP